MKYTLEIFFTPQAVARVAWGPAPLLVGLVAVNLLSVLLKAAEFELRSMPVSYVVVWFY
jgi:hypothetical protein